MKAYTEYLQAHPAVWEALQEEWEPEGMGDWFVATQDYEQVEGDDWPCVDMKIGELNCTHDAYRIDDDGKSPKDVGMWLPTLGQLVRMLEKTECGFTLYSPDIEDDELEYKLTSYQVVDFDMDEDEPEIACTALWAKVKGVE